MWKELLKRKKQKRDIDGGRTPLRIPVGEDFLKNQKKNPNKTNNEFDIDINKEYIVDLDIDKEDRDE
jgi:hypothetical protein